MSFAGNQYPNFADKVITTRGDIVRGDSSGDRERYGIGAANTVLTSDGTDPSWAAHGGVPTTTKGDISGFSTTQARIPVGTNNYTILADSAQALGLKYAASSTSTLTTTGDLLAASAANVLTRIAATTSGYVLTANGAGVLPTFQAAGGGATTAIAEAALTADFSTTSTSLVDITGASLTKPNISGGKCFSAWFCSSYNSVGGSCTRFVLNDNGSVVSVVQNQPFHASYNTNCMSLIDTSDSDGNTLKVQMSVSSGTGHAYYANGGDSCDAIPKLSCMGVG